MRHLIARTGDSPPGAATAAGLEESARRAPVLPSNP